MNNENGITRLDGQAARNGSRPLERNCAGRILTLPPCISVAAGVSPAVEPGVSPGGQSGVPRNSAFRAQLDGSGRQDAALYGRRDARRYVVVVSRCARPQL